MRQQRGVLTEEIQKKSKELLGYDLIENELRLMPYIQYIVTNEKRIYRENLNALDKAILEFWIEKGYISCDLNYHIEITKSFWDAICEILYIGYVDIDK
jgi:hypothetical protein